MPSNLPPSLVNPLDELFRLLPDDFSREILKSARHALEGSGALRLNAFSAPMRNLFEHLMDRLAPNKEIMDCCWFKPERDNGLPTRAQRITYAIQGGISDEFITDKLHLDHVPLRRRVLATIDEFAKHVHLREDTVVRERSRQNRIAKDALDALVHLIGEIASCRTLIVEPILEALDRATLDAVLSDSMVNVDALASHFSLDDVYVEKIDVQSIGPMEITYRATGSVGVTLQWGSNSDLRRGDGAELGQSFPFGCTLTVDLQDPWDLSYAESEVWVDESSWRDTVAPDEWDG